MEMKIIEMEMVELKEEPWKTVNKKKEKPRKTVNKKKKKKKNQLMRRPWDALPSLALFNIFRNLNFKDRFGSFPLVCTAWNSVVNNKKKKNQLMRCAPWDALPSLALLNICRNLNFKDRFGSIPLVCKSWNSIISNDPRCWSSMIPDSKSPDDAFIKKPDYSFQVDPPSKLYDSEGQEIVRDQGVSYLRNFIKKSTTCSSLGEGGGSSSSSTITSLFLDPFHFSNSDTNDSIHQDEILGLIAQCCPNLKHISFDGFYCASREAVLEVFKSCKKIELIDFSDSEYADPNYYYSVQVIEELGKCLPNLRGIRIAGWIEYDSFYDAIATHLPRIKLLALDYRRSCDYDFRKLTSETECCLTKLQYLSVGLWEIEEPPVVTHIPEFHYEKLLGYECHDHDYEFQPLRSVHQSKNRPRRYTSKRQVCHACLSMNEAAAVAAEAEAEAEKAYSECCEKYFSFEDEDYSVMKQKKEYEYYLSISKEQKKKKTRINHRYVVLKTRMRKNKEEASFISKPKMRKKSDKYDYQDYYVQPLL